jgi:hypothetical protein
MVKNTVGLWNVGARLHTSRLLVKLIDWFKTVAFALNDDEPDFEFARYPVNKMVPALNDALCIVYKYRQDLFTEWRIVKLEGGKYQDMRGCCDQILDIADQTDEQGNVIKTLHGARNTTTKVKRNWNKPSCITRSNAPDGFILDNAAIDMNMNGRFTVNPPVPCDADVYVRVKCVSGPCPYTVAHINDTANVHCDMMVAAWHFVLARMLEGDRFTNAASSNTSSTHYKMFFDILGVTMQQEERLETPEKA